MDILTWVLLLAVMALGAVLLVVLLRRGDGRSEASLAQQALADTVQRVEQSLREQERALSGLIEARLAKSEETSGKVMAGLLERLVRIDEAQKKLGELSQEVVSLQQILSNKQARGAFGEVQLNDLVTAVLPPGSFELQCTLSTGVRADCLLRLPKPPGPIAIDAKFPLESYHLLRAAPPGDAAALAAAQRAFQLAMRKHISDIRDKYIVPGETAESALLFLPSEAIYAELHANFPGVVDESYKARVWIVSPTTMWATLNTVRAVLKDVRMRQHADEIQKTVGLVLEDVRRLDERVQRLKTHFTQTEKDIRDIETSTTSITRRGERILEVDLGEPAPALPQKL